MGQVTNDGGAVLGIEVVDLRAKGAGQDKDFSIGHATHLGFDLGDRASGQPPAEHTATGREFILSDVRGGPQAAYLRSDWVARFHAPVSELDGTRNLLVLPTLAMQGAASRCGMTRRAEAPALTVSVAQDWLLSEMS
jgi:hypothetical protein